MTKTSSDEGYFVVRSGEDGTSIDGPISEAELLKRITPNEHGETYYGLRHGFHVRIPPNDKGYWSEKEGEECLLIIRGKIVVPQVVAVKFALP